MPQTIVIVGAGQAAAQATDSLRRGGHEGAIVLVGEEAELPYQRPPLSKKFLSGELPPERLAIRPASFYETQRVELKLGRRAETLDLGARTLTLDDGTRQGYDRLLLATGTVPRKLTVPGATLAGIHYLRTVADVNAIRGELAAAQRVVIVGGGYIGLEVAATCRGLGAEVDVLEMADRVMNRVVAPEVSAFYAAEHARGGVRIHTNTFVSGFRARADDAGKVGAVESMGGVEFAADLVVVGIGVVAVSDLAERAGLAVENGIAVDEYTRTTDPYVWAAGDCSNHPSPRFGRRVRLESVDNAFEQAKTAAANMLGGTTVHDKVPWFWSDQYDLKLLIVGLNFDYDEVLVRGDPASRSFACGYFRAGELLALDSVNSPKDYMAAKKLIAERARIDRARFIDPAVALKDALA
jgi:3-phenylpropionate/trans-cinnamate dioxygenase ferredoxin reductase subunit